MATGSQFLQMQFEQEACKIEALDPLQALICDEAIQLSDDFDSTQMQQSWSWRNVHLARELAKMMIDKRGEIDRQLLLRAIHLLEEHLYSLGPDRQHDVSGKKHLIKILRLFHENISFSRALKSISCPLGHQGAQQLVRETLMLAELVPLTDIHARQAALCALLTYLRQNVGSCFATAPAIVVQQDQPLQFLIDIGQLLATGCIKRIYEGNEYSVPLSISWGMGDLLRPISVASFGQDPLKTIAFSPGLQAAFEICGLIDKNGTREAKSRESFRLLQASGVLPRKHAPFIILTADQILKSVLLKTFDLTQEEVIHFQERVIDPFSITQFISQPQGSKSAVIEKYLKAYQRAKGAFKALADNALLKAWEFTLASLSEAKADCAKWNLYASLGVNHEDPHGIGESLYMKLQEKIELINQEITKCQSHYDHLFAQAKYLEGRIAYAQTKQEVGSIRTEYQMRQHEINRAISEQDVAYETGRRLQHLYPLLIKFYGEKIPSYFQEVYDSQMHDVSTNPYDDSPAGFRLMYKYGRSNSSLWTMINSATEYIQHLINFFTLTEIELHQLPEMDGLQKYLSELVTTIITTIKRPEFLESSLRRLARAYREPIVQNPLENLDRVGRKPWSYISGGTMGTLVSCYWGKPNLPSESKRWIENANEYLAFLIDSVKELPAPIQHLYQKESEKNMLAFSPTHAFNCKPGWDLFSEAWQSDVYTYTWIKDHWMVPQQRFLNALLLDKRMMERIVAQLLLVLPVDHRAMTAHALNRFSYSLSVSEFREMVIQRLSYEKWLHKTHYLQHLIEELDSILYRFLPLFPEHFLEEKLMGIFEGIDEIDSRLKERIYHFIPVAQESIGKYKILTAQELKEIAQGLLIGTLKTTRSSINYHQLLIKQMRKQGLCYPEPFLFADTNWVKNVFGFTVNPGSARLELWRFDDHGEEGRPMGVWKDYLNGKERLDWGFYTDPKQYGEI